MNTEKRDNIKSQKPNPLFRLYGYSILLAIFGSYWGLMYCTSKTDRATYIVKDKAEQKIAYAPIENQSDLHVMEFGPFGTDSLLYKNLNVGDTIFGRKSALDKTVVAASCPHTEPYIGHLDVFSDTRDYDIFTVNGKSLNDIKRKAILAAEQARRDSLICQMKHR